MPRNVKGRTADGRSARWDEHRDQRRQQFVTAAVAAIERHGPNASVASIADEAGVSKPVLYRYFSDKAELNAAVGTLLAEQVLERMVAPLLDPATPIRARVAGAVDAYLEAIAEHPQAFLLLVRHRVDGSDPLADGKERIITTFARVIGDGLRHLGVDAAGAEPWAHGLVGLGLSTGEWWLARNTMSQTAVATYLTEFVWHAFEGICEEYGVPLTALDTADSDTPAEATAGLPAAVPITKGRR